MNCGFQYHDIWGDHREWNASPVEWMSGKFLTPGMKIEKGFFVLGNWGSTADEDASMMIPVSSVMSIEGPKEW